MPTRTPIRRTVTYLIRTPGDHIIELKVRLMTRRRWERHWADRLTEDTRIMVVGPLVVAMTLTF